MKTVMEVAVRLENRPGTLSEVVDLLGTNGINILGMTVRTEGKYGTLNVLTTDPARVLNILESSGYHAAGQEIIAAEVPSHPGGLNAILKPLKLAGVNVEYLYSSIGTHGSSDRSLIFLAVSDLAAAHAALEKEWIKLRGEELYMM
jgi:hypothetical protein